MQCPICLSNIRHVCELDLCGHVYCTACIDRWFEKHDSCPLCRQSYIVFQNQSLNIKASSLWDDDVFNWITLFCNGVGKIKIVIE